MRMQAALECDQSDDIGLSFSNCNSLFDDIALWPLGTKSRCLLRSAEVILPYLFNEVYCPRQSANWLRRIPLDRGLDTLEPIRVGLCIGLAILARAFRL
jgi:hypothetical protein